MIDFSRLTHWKRLALDTNYRHRRNELHRLQQLPNRVATSTDLIGEVFDIVDAQSFLYTYSEIFERHLYRFRTDNPSPVIIDAGANVGISTIYFKLNFPHSRVIAFEPDPQIFNVLKNNCERYGFTNLELVPKAAWTAESSLRFKQDGAEAGRITELGNSECTIDVPACRLKNYLVNAVDFLKLDIEGAETAVLLDCEDELTNVERVFVEYHSFAGQPQTLDKIIGVLTSAGFRLMFQPVTMATQPFDPWPIHMGMDMQINIFGVRQ